MKIKSRQLLKLPHEFLQFLLRFKAEQFFSELHDQVCFSRDDIFIPVKKLQESEEMPHLKINTTGSLVFLITQGHKDVTIV